MTQWFSSDWHLFHENMFLTFKIKCQECDGTGYAYWRSEEVDTCPECFGRGEVAGRPFSSIKEMHDCMIEAHNARVKTTDHYTNLGDVSLLRSSKDKKTVLEEVRKFNGHRRLMLGNHDWFDVRVYREVFEKVRAFNRISNLIFSHIPIDRGSIGRGVVNVHGHIHTNPAPKGPYINLSVEAINYAPVSLEDLQTRAALLLKGLNNGGENS